MAIPTRISVSSTDMNWRCYVRREGKRVIGMNCQCRDIEVVGHCEVCLLSMRFLTSYYYNRLVDRAGIYTRGGGTKIEAQKPP